MPSVVKERKKTDNPREGWEDGTPPPRPALCEREAGAANSFLSRTFPRPFADTSQNQASFVIAMSLALASSSLALNVAPRSGPVKAVAAEPVASKADFAYGLPVRRRHAPRSRLPARAHSPPAPAPLLLSPHPL